MIQIRQRRSVSRFRECRKNVCRIHPQRRVIDQISVAFDGFEVGLKFGCQQRVLRLLAPGVKQSARVLFFLLQLSFDRQRRSRAGVRRLF